MSISSNNQSQTFFATEANYKVNQDHNSLNLTRNGTDPTHVKQGPVHSAILIRNKTSLKQKSTSPITPQLESIINKIQQFVDDIDHKIQNRVQFVKQVYLNQYKQQVLSMSQQLKSLRQKLDNEQLKQRANQKMFYLEEERDFFRSEVLKLNEQLNKIGEENKNIKRLVDTQKQQLQNYNQIVYNLQSKIIKMKSSNIQREKFLDADIKTKNGSTLDTKYMAGSKTQRLLEKGVNPLDSIQNSEQRQMSNTGYKLRPSQSLKSYKKFSTPQRQIMRSTAALSYPKITTQKLQKIEGYSQLLQRQRIVDQCISEMKKQIYYRNLSIGERQGKIHFSNQYQQVKFQSFTKTDKKQLIIKLISNQKTLNEFYQFLFNKKIVRPLSNTPSSAAQDLIQQKLDQNNNMTNKFSVTKFKLTDSKFNAQQLTNLKTQFNKKIFDIKNNR